MKWEGRSRLQGHVRWTAEVQKQSTFRTKMQSQNQRNKNNNNNETNNKNKLVKIMKENFKKVKSKQNVKYQFLNMF